MTTAAFLSAVLALLLAPGPTNTLVAVAGAQRGLRRVLRLLPAELLGYFSTILPLVHLGAALTGGWPMAAAVLKVAAAAWVMMLAVRLWRVPGAGGAESRVTAGRVYLTTMLNPKALVFGLVLLPPSGAPDFAPRLALFSLTVAAVALLWGGAGTLARAGAAGGGRLLLVRRIASVWLASVSITLLAGVIRA